MAVISSKALRQYGAAEAAAALPRYGDESHKYTHGTLVVVGGSRRFSGAPMLASTSALYAGAGVVVACIPASAELFCRVPLALIVHRLPDDGRDGVFSSASLASWEREITKATALVIGPGMDNHPQEDVFLAEALSLPLPKVVDADALNRISANPALLPKNECRGTMVLTPHEGEFARLAKAFGVEVSGCPREERAVMLASATGCVVLLKGAGTIVATPEGDLTVNASGNPRLATAGSGDVLSGVIGAFLAQGVSPAEAARLGAFFHGLAADELPAFIADDLPPVIAKKIAQALY